MHSDDTLPDQCIVFESEFDKAPFYLRVRVDGGVDQVELQDSQGPAKSLPAAIAISVRKGYAPTHWIRSPGGSMSTIARATIERLQAETRTS